MEAIIKTPLNKAQANALFEEECIFMGDDVVPEYRIVELYGPDIAAWAETCSCFEGYLQAGRDYNVWGHGYKKHLRVFHKAGFMKCTAQHNSRFVEARHDQSPAGQIIKKVWEARDAQQAAADAEELRRAEEAKAKRRAAREARKAQQAQEKPADRAESQQAATK